MFQGVKALGHFCVVHSAQLICVGLVSVKAASLLLKTLKI